MECPRTRVIGLRGTAPRGLQRETCWEEEAPPRLARSTAAGNSDSCPFVVYIFNSMFSLPAPCVVSFLPHLATRFGGRGCTGQSTRLPTFAPHPLPPERGHNQRGLRPLLIEAISLLFARFPSAENLVLASPSHRLVKSAALENLVLR